jgi:hypothetical protein
MKLRLLLSVACLLAALAPAQAWWPKGHSRVAEAAVRTLPADVPAFFREGHALVAHCSQDPDLFKSRQAPALRNGEEPEHYLDRELLEGRPLPETRYEFVKLCAEMKLDASAVGTLPYAVAEGTERLAVAFAEHRRWPENPHIRVKALVYAGGLAHYAGDMCMPLHVTVHWDGRARPDGSSPRTGIHAKVDALIEKAPLPVEELAREQRIEAAAPLFPAVVRQIENSQGLVERVYALEAKLPAENAPWNGDPEVLAFTRERAREATRFLASLYLAAWRHSSSVRLPPWHEREGGLAGGAARR